MDKDYVLTEAEFWERALSEFRAQLHEASSARPRLELPSPSARMDGNAVAEYLHVREALEKALKQTKRDASAALDGSLGEQDAFAHTFCNVQELRLQNDSFVDEIFEMERKVKEMEQLAREKTQLLTSFGQQLKKAEQG